MDWKEELKLYKSKFDGKKDYWEPEEVALAYRIWNGAHAEQFGNRVDTGCNSCRRTVIIGVMKLAKEI